MSPAQTPPEAARKFQEDFERRLRERFAEEGLGLPWWKRAWKRVWRRGG